MDFLSEYLQVIVTMAVISGTALIAGICDALKTNNENLRAELLEWKLRHQQLASASAMPLQGASPSALAEPEPSQPLSKPAARATRPEASRGTAIAGSSTRGTRMRASAAQSATRRPPSTEAIAAMQQGLQMASGETQPAPADPAQSILPSPATPSTPPATAEPAPKPESPDAEPPEPESKVRSRLLPRTLVPNLDPEIAPRTEAAAATSDLPAGWQDGYILTRLVQAKRPVTGLVISIGVKTNGASSSQLPEAVPQLIRGLLGPQDFACPSGPNEFLLILPQLSGVAAQNRLNEIAHQLWVFQLKSMGSFSILFSWGGVEVQSESIESAIRSASERMQQTKHSKDLAMQHAV